MREPRTFQAARRATWSLLLAIRAADAADRDWDLSRSLLAELGLSSDDMEMIRPVLRAYAACPKRSRRPALQFVGSSTQGLEDALVLALSVEPSSSHRRGLSYALTRLQETSESRMVGVPAVSGKGKPLLWRSKTRSIAR